MSRYLIERIEAQPNIELLCRTEIVALTGTPEGWLGRVRWGHAPTGAETEWAIRNVFMFIGADPATNWLRACGVGLDANGFVQTQDRQGVNDLLEYEARFNLVSARYSDPVICAYDLTKFGAGVVMDVLRTHPLVIIGGSLQVNPFFVPPAEFLRERDARSSQVRVPPGR